MLHIRHFYILLPIITIAGLTCCSENNPAPYEETVIDGVRVRTYGHDAAPPLYNPYNIEEGTLFGADQGEDSYILSSAGMAGRADDGSVYISDSRQRRLYRFSLSGELLDTFGQRGEGPGEFQSISSTVLEDEIVIWDSRLSRLSHFNLEGLLLRTQIIETTSRVRMPDRLVPYDIQGKRHYIAFRNLGRTELLGSPPCEARYEALHVIQILDNDLKFVRTIRDTTRIIRAYAFGSPIRVYAPSPAKYAKTYPTTSIRMNLPLATNWGHEYRIDFYNPEDGSKWAVTFERNPIPVTKELRETEYTTWIQRGLEEQARRYLQFADYLPQIGYLIWDSAGRLWVMDNVPPGSEPSAYIFNVFSKEGEWLYQQQLPVRPSSIDRTGFFARTSLEDGTPVVQYFAFREQ